MRRCVDGLIALGLVLAGTATSARDAVPRLDTRQALLDSQAVVGSMPPDFTLLDTQGRPVKLSSFRGKPLLVSFIYTGCFTICPTQTRALLEAVQGLDRMLGPHQFAVASIGFNQPFDSPQAMRAFAAQHRIRYPNWVFLSPPRMQVDALTKAFGFSYVETPAGFDHIVGVTVVDAQGRIRGQVYGDRLTAEALGVPLRQLVLAAPPEGSLPSLTELVERVRILCTVYDPDTGTYRYDWKLLLEVVGGLGFFASVGVYLWHEWRGQRPARRPLAGGAS